jgi:hypothetical protein
MSEVEWAQAAIEHIRQADHEAEQAKLAFALGDMDGYFERKASEAKARLESMYERANAGG